MSVILQITATVIFILEFIIGSLANGFIAFVNCMDWAKKRKLSLVDQLLTALAISRISILWVLLLNCWLYVINPTLLISKATFKITLFSWIMTNHFTIWLATSLSIFFFLKIAVFSNLLFLYLKWRFQRVISGTLFLSLIFLFLNIFITWIQIDVWVNEYDRNMSYYFKATDFEEFPRISSFQNFVFTLIPFSVSVVAFILLIFSLWKHLANMQHSALGSRDASTTAHIKALKTIISFLILYVSFICSLFLQVWTFEKKMQLHIFIAKTILAIFPSVHSFVLILGNSKLSQALPSVMQKLRF